MRSDGLRGALIYFLFPKLSWKYLIRLLIIAGLAFIVFGYLFRPMILNGGSMLPTYPESGFLFSWNGAFWFLTPQLGEVVICRFTDDIYYLKRIVGVPGDVIEWRDGRLIRNGEVVDEPYVKLPCEWNSEPVKVEPGHYFVVGDNRSMNKRNHRHGQLLARRIVGVPSW